MSLILSGAQSAQSKDAWTVVQSARRQQPRPLDQAALHQAALDYLAHYASSSANLRRVLLRRIARAAGDARAEDGAAARLADAAVARIVAAGLLDDRAYAAQLAASLHRRGSSSDGIRRRLAEKGVAAEHVAAALAELGAPRRRDIAAACALVRRRRLGPYRSAASRADFRDRDLGVLARAGFGFDVARLVLAAPDAAALDRLADDPV
jgi:regulatory protein